MTNKTDEKSKIKYSDLNDLQAVIEELEEEDKRLCGVIDDLYKDLRRYNRKVKMQDHIIDTQQDIINALVELVGLINDKK